MVRQVHHKVKIYTKTGDKGETSLFGGKRVPKYHLRVEAYGTVDELNSAIGVAIVQVSSSRYQVADIKRELMRVQNDLLDIGSTLASPGIKNQESRMTHLTQRVNEFEKEIDRLIGKLPKLTNFILPGGGKVGALLHSARAICRRAERRTVALSKKEKVNTHILIYLNRLSDLFFTMARYVNWKEKKKEILWQQSPKV